MFVPVLAHSFMILFLGTFVCNSGSIN
jgi:hypothetical protein